MASIIKTTPIQNDDGSITFTTSVDVDALMENFKANKNAEGRTRYLNLLKPDCLLYCDDEEFQYIAYGKDRWGQSRATSDNWMEYFRKEERTQYRGTKSGLHWITPEKVFVPFNEPLFRKCVIASVSAGLTAGKSDFHSNKLYSEADFVDNILHKAVRQYYDTDYYKENYVRETEKLSKWLKEQFVEPEILTRNVELQAEVKRLTDKSDETLRSIQRLLEDLPRSATAKLRSDIENLARNLR
jgi:hypothetical protein